MAGSLVVVALLLATVVSTAAGDSGDDFLTSQKGGEDLHTVKIEIPHVGKTLKKLWGEYTSASSNIKSHFEHLDMKQIANIVDESVSMLKEAKVEQLDMEVQMLNGVAVGVAVGGKHTPLPNIKNFDKVLQIPKLAKLGVHKKGPVKHTQKQQITDLQDAQLEADLQELAVDMYSSLEKGGASARVTVTGGPAQETYEAEDKSRDEVNKTQTEAWQMSESISHKIVTRGYHAGRKYWFGIALVVAGFIVALPLGLSLVIGGSAAEWQVVGGLLVFLGVCLIAIGLIRLWNIDHIKGCTTCKGPGGAHALSD